MMTTKDFLSYKGSFCVICSWRPCTIASNILVNITMPIGYILVGGGSNRGFDLILEPVRIRVNQPPFCPWRTCPMHSSLEYWSKSKRHISTVLVSISWAAISKENSSSQTGFVVPRMTRDWSCDRRPGSKEMRQYGDAVPATGDVGWGVLNND